MLKVLEGFHHRLERRTIGMMAKLRSGGKWECPSVVKSMEAAELHPIRVYIKRQQMTIVEIVAFQPVYTLCMEEERMSGTRRLVRWWDQDAVNELGE